jgi:hypothetical protein
VLCCDMLCCAVQAPDAEYAGPTAIAAVKQPETTYSKLLKELHDRWGRLGGCGRKGGVL